MKRILARFACMLLFLFGWFVPNVHAYNEAGHYFTLIALYESTLSDDIPEQSLSEFKLEAFCAQLPDLAKEFDAITQRILVLESLSDNLWGLLGRCKTDQGLSSHMVATHNYLHGLSGAPALPVRLASKQIIDQLTDELAQKGLTKGERSNLICARGFALHLFGDSFAHVKLRNGHKKWFSGLLSTPAETEMYDVGLGHTRDSVAPDYFSEHEVDANMWSQYVRDVSAIVAPGADVNRVISIQKCNKDSVAVCENDYKNTLDKMITMREPLMVDIHKLLREGSSGIGNMERATSCHQVVQWAFPEVTDRPDCATVWKLYLQKAIPSFYQHNVDPIVRPGVKADKSCSAWQCKDKSQYEGESPTSCSVEIIDRLTR
ncbi:MAG: hypothetical protein HQL55_09965 [Magnetococcales bacterium]|nr:hypothetical protein [Magnetococcales bacterium]